MRKDKLKKEYFSVFAVFAEGYIYFFKSNKDSKYYDCVFVRNAIINELEQPANTIEITNRFTLEFF